VLTKVTEKENQATALGCMYAVTALAALICPFIGAFLLQEWYIPGVAWFSVLNAIAAAWTINYLWRLAPETVEKFKPRRGGIEVSPLLNSPERSEQGT